MEEEAPKPKNKFNLKNKKIIGVFISLLIILLLVGGAILFVSSKSSSTDDSADMMDTSTLPELKPEDIGMVVTVRKDNQALMFKLNKADDIARVEYTIEYEAQTDEGTANQGIFGEMNIGEDGITETDFREFGTCSAGKCRYDNVTSDVTINLKVTKKDGKEYQVTKVVKLDS